MIPARALGALALVLAALGTIVALLPALTSLWLLAATLIALIATADAVFCFVQRAPLIERRCPASLSLATWTKVVLDVRNLGSRAQKLQIFDHHPASFTARELPLAVNVPAGRFVDIGYDVCPTRRGPTEFTGCELRIGSPFGLWWRRRFVPLRTEVRVYPNYSTISRLLAYEVDNRLQLTGVRLSRRRGEGIEFHQLRDYREGDSLRSIDWKATARLQRLIAREYQDERDQQVVFMLDAGRRMLAKDAELSHFDHTLNAMLLLSYIALRHGDAAGVMTVGATRSWLPPRKGADAINGLLNHVYSVEPQAVEVDFVAAAAELATRQRRRSLVVILTNVREEDSDDLRLATSLLRRRHLVMLASLRERALDDALTRDIHNYDAALSFAATHQYLNARRDSQDLLRANGIMVEDCLTDELPAAITNRYLAIKRAGAL